LRGSAGKCGDFQRKTRTLAGKDSVFRRLQETISRGLRGKKGFLSRQKEEIFYALAKVPAKSFCERTSLGDCLLSSGELRRSALTLPDPRAIDVWLPVLPFA
jgi:hypothetical protein